MCMLHIGKLTANEYRIYEYIYIYTYSVVIYIQSVYIIHYPIYRPCFKQGYNYNLDISQNLI